MKTDTHIELVIKIDKDTYNDIQSHDWKNGIRWYSEEWKAIHNGTPLPKGHGRLIDADVFEKRLMNARSYYIGEKADDFDLRFAAGLKSAAERLVDAPTIVETDE